MSELLQLIFAFAAGILLGLVFFWGLWLTIAGLPRAPRPGLRLLGSLLLRLGLVLAGFYFIARNGDWQPVLAAALGFTLPRLLLVRRLALHHLNRESDA
ncbi:ATP synthase subunit I [Thiohalobacter thiocyanaticus]|uniref:ATP synthase subunit I n=1 Tax=Thiohalobacter thiocyanaticus TaxID=585455 RepID=A0A426QGX1_9GAMM|nr:ATP synthase subunit I [Thiohalobacter thiocyanaticus]RRQ21008.1 ATP synthase subunit I [Thiohalobacter thiocyanaticus]